MCQFYCIFLSARISEKGYNSNKSPSTHYNNQSRISSRKSTRCNLHKVNCKVLWLTTNYLQTARFTPSYKIEHKKIFFKNAMWKSIIRKYLKTTPSFFVYKWPTFIYYIFKYFDACQISEIFLIFSDISVDNLLQNKSIC